jgi:hypothetical protein
MREGAKIYKTYEAPKTPYERVLKSKDIPEENKDKLKAIYLTLNPAKIKRDMIKVSDKLHALRIPYRQYGK